MHPIPMELPSASFFNETSNQRTSQLEGSAYYLLGIRIDALTPTNDIV